MRGQQYYREQRRSNHGMLVVRNYGVWLSIRVVHKFTCSASASCNGQLLDTYASAWWGVEMFCCVKHVILSKYEMRGKYFGMVAAYG